MKTFPLAIILINSILYILFSDSILYKMSNIEKVKLIDSRIVQKPAQYAVNVGSQSITSAKFQAVSSTSSGMTFNINVPSQNTFIDRTVSISTGTKMKCTVTHTAIADDADVKPVALFGKDLSLPAFPLQSNTNTMSATINDATVSTNLKDVMYEILRLTNNKKNRKQRTCPTMLDKVQNYNASDSFLNSQQSGYGSAMDYDNVPNGAYFNVYFTDPTGNKLTGTGTYTYNGVVYPYVNGIPTTKSVAGSYLLEYPIFYTYNVTEKLLLSPFIYSEEESDNVGLYGVSNLQFILNFGDAQRSLRVNGIASGITVTGVSFLNNAPFIKPEMNVIFRTPSLMAELPKESVIPYMDTPRFLSPQQNVSIPAGGSLQISSNTTVLSQIPDMFLIYCKPSQYLNTAGQIDNTQADWYLTPTKVSCNFDNFSGLMASMTKEQLFELSIENGLDMDYNCWNGQGKASNRGLGALDLDSTSGLNQANIPLVGGFLVIKPSKDLAIQNGSASGMNGNYSFQIDVTVQNQTSRIIQDPVLTIVAVNSGFVRTVNGSTSVTKSPLKESDVIQAQVGKDSQSLNRMVGGSFLGKLSSTLMKLAKNKDVRNVAKKLARVSGAPYANEGVDILESVGFGQTGGAVTGGRKPRNKSYLKHLM